jgi:hypothetical protein
MRTPASEHVTLVEVLELTRPFEEFAAAIRAAARRLEAEGIKELVTLQFYADPGSTEVGAILTVADRTPRDGAHRHDHEMGTGRMVLRNRKGARHTALRQAECRRSVGLFSQGSSPHQ